MDLNHYERLMMKPLIFNREAAGEFDRARDNMDKEAKLQAKVRKIPWRSVRRELTGTPDNMVATYYVPKLRSAR